jgi:hypothetical protein
MEKPRQYVRVGRKKEGGHGWLELGKRQYLYLRAARQPFTAQV